MLVIKLCVPGRTSEVRTLDFGRHVIGSGLLADIRLRHASVAKRHAAISIDPVGPLLRDLGAQGLRRNGVVVSYCAPLMTGDVLLIGECEVVVMSSGFDAREPAPPGSAQANSREPTTCILAPPDPSSS